MIDIGFVYFKSLTLQHLDAAWYSLSRQDFTHVRKVIVVDNDTPDPIADIEAVLARYPLPVPVQVHSYKHGNPKRTQSWSVNRVMVYAWDAPLVFFTRADYILDFTCLQKFRALAGEVASPFITSYAYHMAYDERGDQRIEGFRDIEPTGWRTHGPQVLLEAVNGWRVDSSHLDAGVWLMERAMWEWVSGLDERLSAWGFQQTLFQRELRAAGADIVQIPEFLFFHQHHAAPRSYDVAHAELQAIGESAETLKAFRDVASLRGAVCDELDKHDH